MLERLRRRWALILAVTLVALITINVCEMSYNDLQTAPDAVAFRHALTSHARALGATGCDVVFAMGYALLGLVGLRALGWPTRFARPAAVLVVASALFDVLENLLLMRNIVAERTLTD